MKWIIRIRTSSKTVRLLVDEHCDSGKFLSLVANAVSIPEPNLILSLEPSLKDHWKPCFPFLDQSVLHYGDMIFAGSTTGKTKKPVPVLSTHSSCLHGPNQKCIHCLSPDTNNTNTNTTSSPYSTFGCDHGPNILCTNCGIKKKNSHKNKNKNKNGNERRIKWLCTHPPDAKCPNCISSSPPKKKASKKPSKMPCSHPPSMKCPNCLSAKSLKKKVKSKCLHGDNAMCEHCVNKNTMKDETPPVYRICRNHGPNGSCIECLSWKDEQIMKITQPQATKKIKAILNYHAANLFQSYLQSCHFREQRVGYLYGSIDLKKRTTTVEAIYEPPQQNEKYKIHLLQDPLANKVATVASLLGLCPVGIIISHALRSYVMSSQEVALLARHQNAIGPGFIAVFLSCNEKNQSNLEAFQLSDQVCELEKKGHIVLDSPDPKSLQVNTPVIVEGKQTTFIDTHFFPVTIPVLSNQDGVFREYSFPPLNRHIAPQLSDLKIHMINSAPKPHFYERIADFHLLLYLATTFDVFDFSTDIPVLCEAVKSANGNEEALEGFKLIIDSLLDIY